MSSTDLGIWDLNDLQVHVAQRVVVSCIATDEDVRIHRRQVCGAVDAIDIPHCHQVDQRGVRAMHDGIHLHHESGEAPELF